MRSSTASRACPVRRNSATSGCTDQVSSERLSPGIPRSNESPVAHSRNGPTSSEETPAIAAPSERPKPAGGAQPSAPSAASQALPRFAASARNSFFEISNAAAMMPRLRSCAIGHRGLEVEALHLDPLPPATRRGPQCQVTTGHDRRPLR